MKNQEKLKISKFSDGFEIGKMGQSTILGGGPTNPGGGSGPAGDQKTTYYEFNNQACSITCPDSKVDTYAG
jgi:hypothetical protein